ncbi:hypothetical protein AURDEDRAFT_140062 [Auricularia subglabra TFB-10046 SS5]|uniref:Beta-glucuronidase C-terminal domain-containing protein n=1 Tax=Auricularia subglabra (strain TFB-10046 / SS5) TaxID=717982 RepID=J0CYU0_AURST|nr:hypothetical protein AURDEDRAFT_140062 [Auricularia subglabra TFB-10046 SS5]
MLTRGTLPVFLGAVGVLADVSIYPYPVPIPTPGAAYVGWQAYDPTTLADPPLPQSIPPLDFQIQLDTSGNPTASQATLGSFLGISIEMSLSEAVSASWLRPQFLNFMSALKERGGPPVLRLGGNTQEKAELVDSLPGGASLAKFAIGPTGYTNTPTLQYTLDILKALRAASDLLEIKWFLGVPMNQTDPPRLEIVEKGETVMGEYLWGWQLGNEPDLYALHNYRSSNYTELDYMDEYQSILADVTADPNIQVKNNFGGPGVCCLWDLGDLINNQNYLGRFGSQLNSLIIEHYPLDNCDPSAHDPQQVLNSYMIHSFAQAFSGQYSAIAATANAAGKPVILLETNTASCNGFRGLSDSFAAALWATDLALNLASVNFTHMMLHLGGQAAYYNPFVPPPHNASAPFMWTVGPPMYAILLVAEALGTTGQARVADLGANGNNAYTPGYVIYENNQPARLVLLNYMGDTSGASDYTAHVATDASQVKVRYLVAPQVISKTNITFAGQSFGGYFESDGLLRGEHQTETVQCSGGSCPIRVPAPGIALVFLTDSAYSPDDDFKTFATSHTTKMHNTAALPAGALETSNGMNGGIRKTMKLASTSTNKKNAAGHRADTKIGGALILASILAGTGVFLA